MQSTVCGVPRFLLLIEKSVRARFYIKGMRVVLKRRTHTREKGVPRIDERVASRIATQEN